MTVVICRGSRDSGVRPRIAVGVGAESATNTLGAAVGPRLTAPAIARCRRARGRSYASRPARARRTAGTREIGCRGGGRRDSAPRKRRRSNTALQVTSRGVVQLPAVIAVPTSTARITAFSVVRVVTPPSMVTSRQAHRVVVHPDGRVRGRCSGQGHAPFDRAWRHRPRAFGLTSLASRFPSVYRSANLAPEQRPRSGTTLN